MIGILDMEMGNLRSVSNAIYSLGYDPKIVQSSDDIAEASHLIIPGVGAYSMAMQNIERLNLRAPIRDFAATGKPVLGICIGMQVLADFGDEGGGAEGLKLVPGKVERLADAPGLAIPHVGWNNIKLTGDHPVFAKVKSGVDFYFVHSYRFLCENAADVYAETDYGTSWPSIVGHDNVIGFQFHPEKSQINGLKLLENFCEWNGKC